MAPAPLPFYSGRSPLGCRLRLLLAAMVLVLGACSSRSPRAAANAPAAPLVWPAPPDEPRLAYVQSIHRPRDLGVKLSTITRFGHWLTGSDKGNEPLVKPFGLALDEAGNLCLTDTGANAVCCYDRARNKWLRWDRVGPLRFRSPVAIARRNGIFYVADSALGQVIAFDGDGRLRFQITNHLARPVGLAVGEDRLLVADSQRHRVVVFDLAGGFRSEMGERGTGPGQFNFPTHVAVDSHNRLLVTDSMNHRVQVFEADGRFKCQLGSIGDTAGHFSRPKGVAADPQGRVYVVDALLDGFQIFDPDGRLLLTLGQTGGQPGEFWLPNGIAISRSNEVFVADSYNHRVQILKYVGPS